MGAVVDEGSFAISKLKLEVRWWLVHFTEALAPDQDRPLI